MVSMRYWLVLFGLGCWVVFGVGCWVESIELEPGNNRTAWKGSESPSLIIDGGEKTRVGEHNNVSSERLPERDMEEGLLPEKRSFKEDEEEDKDSDEDDNSEDSE